MLLINLFLLIQFIKANCPFKETIYNESVILKDFKKLNELKFNECKKPIILTDWGLKPNKKIILDNTLNFENLTLLSSDNINFIHLNNFKGFDLMSKPFKDIKFIDIDIIWFVEQSNFEFYLNNKLITNEKECNNNSNWNNLITNSKIYYLMISTNTRYALKTCPYIFNNFQINSMTLTEIQSTFIGSNILTFLKLNNTNNIDSIVKHVDFYLYHIYFDDNLFNREIFKEIKILDLNGILDGIQDDLFKSFNELILIRIRTQHVKKLFAKNNKWLEYLNIDFEPVDPNGKIESFLKQSIFLIIFQSFPKVTFYDYPNEDFCLFNKFPHNKLVFPQLRPNHHNSTCSCTQIYLIQYSFKHYFMFNSYSDKTQTNYDLIQYYFDEINDRKFTECFKDVRELNYLIFKCNFEQRLEKCNIIKSIPREDQSSYFEMYDWQKVSKITTLIFSVYLNTIFSFIIIILNILTLKILKSKSVLNEKNSMYNFLHINTILSMIYVAIFSFKVIGICVDYEFYCSPLIETKFNVYYKTIFVFLIGETLKTAANFSFISFSLSRYNKVTCSNINFLLKLDKLKKRNFFFISLIISVFINLYNLFEYNFNLAEIPGSFVSQKSLELFFKYSNPSDEFIENFSPFQYYLLNVFYYLKIIFSDLSYIVFNLIIDFKLLSFIKIQNARRIQLVTRLTVVGETNQFNSTTHRLTVMIILNGLNCFLLRFPSAFASFYGFIFRFDIADKIFKPNIPSYIVCRGFKICPSLQEILYFLYLFSLFLQFFIFLKFDKIFRKGCSELKNNFLKQLKKNNIYTL
jgi:hypothetical protein